MEKVADQINGTYENGWYDACAVMLRRFVETLIIETYIAKNAESAVKKTDGDFYSLKRLIDEACSGNDLSLSRDTRDILRKLKNWVIVPLTIGDSSPNAVSLMNCLRIFT